MPDGYYQPAATDVVMPSLLVIALIILTLVVVNIAVTYIRTRRK